MKNDNLPGLSPLWLISLALVLGTIIAVVIPISITTNESIKPSDWIGFAGSLVAGAIALLAAILAWFAVQRQIGAQEDAEKRSLERERDQHDQDEAAAKFAAKIVLTHPVHAAAAVMNVTRQYLDARQTEIVPDRVGPAPYGGGDRSKSNAVKKTLELVMAQMEATMSHFAIAEAWKGLNPDDKANYLVITSTLQTITNIYRNQPPITYDEVVSNQYSALTNFATYLRAFDDELAEVFDRDSNL